MGPSSTQSTAPTRYNGIQVQSSVAGSAIPMGWGTFRCGCNLLWYGDFKSVPQKQSAGGKGGGSAQVSSYSYSASIIAGICAGQVASIRTVYKDQTATTLTDAGLSLYTGAIGQTPWPYLSTHFPSQAIGYSGIAYVAAANYQLSTSATLPNHSFEVVSTTKISGLDDANPKDVISQFTAAVPYWLTSWLGNLADYGNYCLANNLVLSPVIDSQRAAREFLREVLDATNSDAVWSEGVLKIVPYGDASATGNGATWTPNLTPVYALDDTVLLSDGEGADPVLLAIGKDDDAWNYVQVEYRDRAQQYNTQVVPGTDPGSIDQWGKRINSSPFSWHCICDGHVAAMAAQLRVQRTANVRRSFSFRLPPTYALLDPMDLVTITSGDLQAVLVRITEITESEDGVLQITAEEMLVGSGSPPAIVRQAPSGYQSNFEVDPGSVNSPVIVSPPLQMTGGELQIWIGASGGANWGGAEIWASWDNTTFQPIGIINTPARYGVTTTTFASGSDPDTSHSVGIDLTTSSGTIDGTSSSNADNNAALALIGAEVISYSAATLTAAHQYTLGTYIRRGLMGSAIASHATGSQFVRLDNSLFAFAYRADQVGKTIYLKFRSFNTFGQGHQDISAVDTYTVTLTPSSAEFTVLAWADIGGRPANLSALTGIETIDNARAAIGTNQLYNSHFAAGLNGWALYYGGTVGHPATLALTTAGAAQISWTDSEGVFTGGSFGPKDYGSLRAGRKLFRVFPGQRIACRYRGVNAGVVNRTTVYGAFLNQAADTEISAGVGWFRSGADCDATHSEGFGYVDVPTGAYWVELTIYPICDGAHGAGSFTLTAIGFFYLADGQTVVPPIGEGPAAIYAADVTAQSQITLSLADITVNATSNGTIASGQLPRTVTPTLLRGQTDIRTASGVVWSVDTISSNLSGYVSIDSGGLVTIASGITGSGSFRLVATISGIVYSKLIEVIKNVAAPSFSSSTSASGDITGFSSSSTSFVEAYRASSMVVASGKTIYCTLSGDYGLDPSTAGTRYASAKWQYSVAGANSWTDFASAVNGSNASYIVTSGEGTPGSITCNQNKAGLSAGNYDVRLVIAINSTGKTLIFGSGPTSVSVS